jgi:hypothetical protein
LACKKEMGQVKEEISNAIQTLSLTPNDIELLDYERGHKIFERCLNKFVNSGDRRWWWEDFKDESFSISNLEKPFEHLEEYIPDLENHVWLMVEDDEEDYYPIYTCNPRKIGNLIGECFGFEYYIISKDLKWLLCENHHSRLIGTGDFRKQNKNITTRQKL